MLPIWGVIFQWKTFTVVIIFSVSTVTYKNSLDSSWGQVGDGSCVQFVPGVRNMGKPDTWNHCFLKTNYVIVFYNRNMLIISEI